ncbi:protein phosphatase 1 regulatory subunit 3A [Stegastes partitus]|nr:PREDICTED: protein phosphatase 1 regulatory subunit 3A [Stegastes partitus]
MEFVGQPSSSGALNLLGVPGLSSLDVDDDEGDVVIGIRPKSSPLPRRKGSATDEDSEFEPPLCGSRRVSFADAKGLSLVQVKEFGTWDVPKLPGCESSEGEGTDAEEFFLSTFTFSLPRSTQELYAKVREQKVELETVELLPGTTILKGIVRVLNISFNKAVYVRTTLDTWSSHFDLLAEYIPGSSDGLMDCFSFKLTLVPPFGEQGARVDFCLRYETPLGTFWANNDNRNYVLFCHHKMKKEKVKPQKENVKKKSCLKTVSQNFSTVENISAKEASSQENISADVSNNGREVDSMKADKTFDGQSGTSEEHRQKLLIENRQNISRRSRRKAARMARVKDFFAQRDGGASDTERDESPPEIKQAAQKETPEEKHTDVKSFSDGNSNSEGSQFVSESLETCNEPHLNVLHDTSPAHDSMSNTESEKSESIPLDDSAALKVGESVTDIPVDPLPSTDEPGPAEQQNINDFDMKAEESSPNENVSYESTNDTAAVNSESLVNQTNSFTFGTVVAPLYRQVFGRAGSESQSIGDWGNPTRASLNTASLNADTKIRQISCIDLTDATSNGYKVQINVTNNQDSNHECVNATLICPPTEEQETSLTVNDVLDCAETTQDPAGIENSDQRSTDTSPDPAPVLGDTLGHPETVNMLNKDLLNPQIHTEGLDLQGEEQEDKRTPDLQSQTTAETLQCQPSEPTCTQIETNLDETLAQSETQEARISLQSSFISLQPSQSEHVVEETDQQTSNRGEEEYVESKRDHTKSKTVTILKTGTSLKEDKLFEVLHDLNSNHTDNLVTEEPEDHVVFPCCELEETDFTPLETSLETQEEATDMEKAKKVKYSSHKDETKQPSDIKVTGEVAESMTKVMISEHHRDGDMFVGLKDEGSLDNIEHCEARAAMSKQDEGFCLADVTEAKNWEMMVEEEENSILTNDEEYEGIHSKTESAEVNERDTTEEKKEELLEEMIVAGVKDNNADNTVGLEDKEWIKEEDIGETVTDLEYVRVTEMEKTFREEKLADVERTEGPKKEKHFAEMPEVNIESANVQEEKEIEGKEKIPTHLIIEGEAGVEWEGEVKTKEENREEEEGPDSQEEILVDQAGEAEIEDAESSMVIKDREDEVLWSEERSDVTHNEADEDLSALVNNAQEGVSERVIDKENTGEGQNAHIPTETCLCKEDGFQNNKSVTHDRSKAEEECFTAEAAMCILTDDPEIDQTSHDNASSESDSDDEVELYMHCLRAVHTGAQAHKDRNKDAGFTVSKRPSISRSKLLSMPSISESLDEEQPLSRLQENPDDGKTAAFAALSASGGQESINRNVSWWKDTFSCSNISKTLLYTTLLVLFLVVAYHYDFLACFGLYLISVVWLYCQGERQPVKNNNRIG